MHADWKVNRSCAGILAHWTHTCLTECRSSFHFIEATVYRLSRVCIAYDESGGMCKVAAFTCLKHRPGRPPWLIQQIYEAPHFRSDKSGMLSVCQPSDVLWLVWVRVTLFLLESEGTYCWIIVIKRIFKGTKWSCIIFTIFATAKIQNLDFWVMKLCIRYSSGPSFATLSKLRARLIHLTLLLYFPSFYSRRAEYRTVVAVLEELLP